MNAWWHQDGDQKVEDLEKEWRVEEEGKQVPRIK